MKKYSYKKIINIKKNGIQYIDNDKAETLDFYDCYNNWLDYQKKIENNCASSFCYIGQRNICDEECFIEFFSKPFIRFEFFNNKESFKTLLKNINDFGWKIIDLS